MKFDLNLTPSDLQQLTDADAIAAFFSRLGYNTNVRTVQTVGNLGLSESVARPIKKLELIADQETLLQVYLVEVQSVRIDHTRNLMRAFRNRSGNHLFVITSDYDRIDFVLLERYEPSTGVSTRIPGQENIGVRPLTLTVNRRKPSKIDLRVLRKLTYTEGDPFAQYEKLRQAYSIAHWSEEHFNNRALFSDYYLLRRLQERPEWSEDPKPIYRTLHELYQKASAKLHQSTDDSIRRELAEPVLQDLGFAIKTRTREGYDTTDYELYGPDHTEKPLAVALVYSWARNLDGKDSEHDSNSPEENPGAVVVSLLEQGVAPWAMVTNGKVWRLYCQRTHSRATNYYEVNLEEILAPEQFTDGGLNEAFRYFWLLFRSQSFIPREISYAGKAQTLSFLDLLLAESADYAKALGERLKESVFVQVFPYLAEGFIAYTKQSEGKDADLSEEALDAIYQGTLTLLYRLLFLLYAEARDLLPVKEYRGYYECSVGNLKAEIADAATNITDDVESKLSGKYTKSSTDLYERLIRLFQVVDKGDSSLNVPMYNGGLFLTEPEKDDDTPEAVNARFLRDCRVPDFFLACAIDKLARDIDPKSQGLVMIDYKDLGVRQLGSIYEGLLEFKLRIAAKKLGVQGSKKREVYVPWSELDERQQAKAEKSGKMVKKGSPYLENDKLERKATGSYYTPDYIVKYIVENSVGPILNKKFDEMRPKLREAQQEYREFLKRRQAFIDNKMAPPLLPQADSIGQELVDELFDIKVLDPAMGSGHFLVEVVDFITDKTLDFLNAFPWNPVVAKLGRIRKTILEEMEAKGITIDAQKLTDVNLLKRYVLKRCVYGVDLNPMAVELAKVSLWLDCFTLGAPLSFLDHHLRCGNSLIGASVQQVIDALEWKVSQTGNMFEDDFARELMIATQSMIEVGELSDVTSAQVVESKQKYTGASGTLAPYKRLLDVYTSQWFGNEDTAIVQRTSKYKSKYDKTQTTSSTRESVNVAIAFLKSSDLKKWMQKPHDTPLIERDRNVAEVAEQAALDNQFFHWELEFPEVYYERQSTVLGRHQLGRRENSGFDAVIGNPPWGADFGDQEKDYFRIRFQAVHVRTPESFNYFVVQMFSRSTSNGRAGAIIPNTFLTQYEFWKTRKELVEANAIAVILNLGEGVFDDVTAPCCILILGRQAGRVETEYADFRQLERGSLPLALTGDARSASVVLAPSESEQYALQVNRYADLFSKCFRWPPLGTVASEVTTGISSGLDSAFVHHISTVESSRLERGLARKLVLGKEVLRYGLMPASELHIIYVTRTTNIDEYPHCKSLLMRFKDHLLRRKEASEGKVPWFSINRPRRAELFEKPKIMIRQTADRVIGAYDPEGWYCLKSVIIVQLPEMSKMSHLYLLGILNSSLIDFLYQQLVSEKGRVFPEVKPVQLVRLPIRVIDFGKPEDVQLHDRLVDLVQRAQLEDAHLTTSTIHMATGNNSTSMSGLEQQIDDVVFQLYGITKIEAAEITLGQTPARLADNV